MELKSYIQKKLTEKKILLMTHIVLGYPSLDESFRIVQEMVDAGVDLVELQIPFSEPTADGPVIVRANQDSLDRGVTVKECLQLAEKIAISFDIPFLIMSYYNILYSFGVDQFVSKMKESGLQGAIIPDLPPEEGKEYFDVMESHQLSPILIFSPTTTFERMQYLASFGRGFIYCVARKGVTGESTDFSPELEKYLHTCREATSLPLAVGFGVKERKDIDYLKEKADIAVIGTQTIRVVQKDGITAVGDFIREILKT